MLNSGVNIQYLHTLVRVEVLHHFDTFSDEVGSVTPENLMSITLGLGTYFFCQHAFKAEVCDMPRNEEAAYFKSKTLSLLSD